MFGTSLSALRFTSLSLYNKHSFQMEGKLGVQNLILNRYQHLAEAGRGGYGTVQVAWDTRIERRVAIKCLSLDALGISPDAPVPPVIPGLDEARLSAMFSDATTVVVYDFEVDAESGMAYLIMEYVDGITLADLMASYDGGLPLDLLTCVFEAVARALEVAHTNKVLHLDIKPDNVMINCQGQVKVSDFGLAQMFHGTGRGWRAAGGTIGYMPLEQMRLEAPDVRTDEWALAALTYEMLTGENPFVADSLEAAEAAIENAELVIPSSARDDVGEEVDEAIFGALAIDREDRFSSVALFADALMPHLGDSRQGLRDLTSVVGGVCEVLRSPKDKTANTEPVPHHVLTRSSLLERLGEGTQRALLRVWSVAVCAFVAVVAATNISALSATTENETPAFWAVLAVCIAAGVAAPVAGSITAILALSAALLAKGAYGLGLVFLIAGCLWWGLVGCRGEAQANAGVSGVALGAFGLGPLAPLVAGYVLRPSAAAATAGFQAIAAFTLATSGAMSLTGWNVLVYGSLSNHMEANASILLGEAFVWVQAISWVVAAVVLAVLCGRASKPLALAGVLVAAVVLALGIEAGVFIASWLSETSGQMVLVQPDWSDALSVMAAVIMLAVCVILVGVPVRAVPQESEARAEEAAEEAKRAKAAKEALRRERAALRDMGAPRRRTNRSRLISRKQVHRRVKP